MLLVAFLLVVFLNGSPLAAGQTSPVPTNALSGCILNCLRTAATSAGCSSFTDVSCVCPSSSSFQPTAGSCLQSCSALDREIAVSVVDAVCATYEGALTILNDLTADPAAASRTLSVMSTESVGSVSSFSMESTSSVASVSSTSSVAAASLSSIASVSSISAASTSSLAAAAAATATQPIDAHTSSASSHPLSSAAVGGVVGGVLGGLLLLLLLGLCIFCVCRRRRRRREREGQTRLDLDWDSSFDPYARERERRVSDSLLEGDGMGEPMAEAAIAGGGTIAPWLAQHSSSSSDSRGARANRYSRHARPPRGARPLPVPQSSTDTTTPGMQMRQGPNSQTALVSPRSAYNITPFTPPLPSSPNTPNTPPFSSPFSPTIPPGAASAQGPGVGGRSPSLSNASIYRTRRASSIFDRSSASAGGGGAEADVEGEPLSPDSVGSEGGGAPSGQFLWRSPSANGAAIGRGGSAVNAAGAAAAAGAGVAGGGGAGGLQRNPSVAAQVKAREAFDRARSTRQRQRLPLGSGLTSGEVDGDGEQLGRRTSVGSVLQHTDGGPMPAPEATAEEGEVEEEVPPRYDMIRDPGRR